MTLIVTLSCNGTFDEGRMPCRGARHFHRELDEPGPPIPLDVIRVKAAAAGWELSLDGDYCPAHHGRHAL